MQGNAPDEEYDDPHGECAAEIRRLQQEVHALRTWELLARAALGPFAKEAESFEGSDASDDLHLTVRDEDGEIVNTLVSVGDLRRAARLMNL